MCFNMHLGIQPLQRNAGEFCNGKYSIAAGGLGHIHTHLAVFISSKACCVNYMVLEQVARKRFKDTGGELKSQKSETYPDMPSVFVLYVQACSATRKCG